MVPGSTVHVLFSKISFCWSGRESSFLHLFFPTNFWDLRIIGLFIFPAAGISLWLYLWGGWKMKETQSCYPGTWALRLILVTDPSSSGKQDWWMHVMALLLCSFLLSKSHLLHPPGILSFFVLSFSRATREGKREKRKRDPWTVG